LEEIRHSFLAMVHPEDTMFIKEIEIKWSQFFQKTLDKLRIIMYNNLCKVNKTKEKR
jgi:hypothetical protein